MNRWALAAVAAVVTLGCAGCGAKLVVVQVPPLTEESTQQTGSTGTEAKPAYGGPADLNGGSQSTAGGKKPDTNRNHVAAPKLTGEGVFYALPRTVARVVVKADKVVTQLAPYARFAPIFAPGAEPLCGTIAKCAASIGKGETTKYSLQQGATFTTFGEPDPSQVFMVKFTDGGALDQTLSMAWNEAGLLSTASASVTNRTTDIVMSGLKLATGLATKAAAGSTTADAARGPGCKKTGEADNDTWIIPILADAGADHDQNPLIVNYCSLPPKDRPGRPDEDSRNDFDKTRDTNDLELATHAYIVRLALLITQRTTVLTSSTVNLLEPVKYVEKLEALIDQQVKDLFVGSKSTKTWEMPFEVRELQPATSTKILGINEASGFCPNAALFAPDAKPAPDGVKVLPEPECKTEVRVSVSYHPGEKRQLFSTIKESVTEPTDEERSFRYRLPAQVKATVAIGSDTYGTGVFSVAQLGHVVSLPARRHAKTISYDLAMIEPTGALKTFKLGTTGGLDAGTIDALSAAGGTVLDARSARRKAEEAERTEAETKADELTVLTRQHSILKLKDEICELQKKYGLACTVPQ